MLNGYTYSKHSRSSNYYCSKKAHGCRAKVKLDHFGMIASESPCHNHDPPKVSTRHWVCSTKFRDCKARLKMDEDGNIISLFNEHCHPRRKFARTVTGDLVRV
ncbi:unnamed protein product [Parnassius mnemosyne]|uniref:Modifier of mdg4 n=1 Tax=Parnassius mnemosyne TaxID=213953 RepID=A0AAV1K816_9NEOP